MSTTTAPTSTKVTLTERLRQAVRDVNERRVDAEAAYRRWQAIRVANNNTSTPESSRRYRDYVAAKNLGMQAEAMWKLVYDERERERGDKEKTMAEQTQPTPAQDSIAKFLAQQQKQEPEPKPEDALAQAIQSNASPIPGADEPRPLLMMNNSGLIRVVDPPMVEMKSERKDTAPIQSITKGRTTMIDLEQFKDTALLRVKVSMWGNTRKGTLSDEAVSKIVGNMEGLTYDEQKQKIADARRRLRLNKSLVDCQEYKAITTWRARFMKYMMLTYMNQSFIDEGLYIIKMPLLPEAVAEIERGRKNLQSLVRQFIEVYKQQQDQAKASLDKQYAAGDYPSPVALAMRFRIDYRVVQLSVPAGLPKEMRQEEERKLRQSFEEARKAVIAALWGEYQAYLDHIVDRLKPGEDGKRKKFNDTLFQNLALFVNAFNNRNAFNDEKLKGLVQKSEEILQAVGGGRKLSEVAEDMRDNNSLRRRTEEAFEKVKEEVARSIVDVPKRSFTLEE